MSHQQSGLDWGFEQENLLLVQEFYAALKREDTIGVLNTLADDVAWFIPGTTDLPPFVGQRRSSGQVAQFIAKLTEAGDVGQFEPREFIAQGGKVVALGHYRWRAKPTGPSYASDLVHVFTVQEGKVSNFREYLDTHAWAAAYPTAQSSA